MNFYHEQDSARRRTRLLLLAFIIMSLVVSLAAGAVVHIAISSFLGRPAATTFVYVMPVASIIFLCNAFVAARELRRLQQGGAVVAARLGGQLVDVETQNSSERRALNVVEEMAIAANLPPPQLFVLPHEAMINAFAAGYRPHDAVIALSRGALEQLDRNELQGVVAHEFAHIANGDIRLNLRLASAVHGLVFLSEAGRFLMGAGRMGVLVGGVSSSRSDKKGGMGKLMLLGVALWLLGSLGGLGGRLLQRGVSRSREYLADASAVRLTRLPDGIASALKRIGGMGWQGRIQHPRAMTYNHLFFVETRPPWLTGWFDSHPPLDDRIRRLEPRWDNQYLSVRQQPVHTFEQQAPIGSEMLGGMMAGVAGAVVMNKLAQARGELENLTLSRFLCPQLVVAMIAPDDLKHRGVWFTELERQHEWLDGKRVREARQRLETLPRREWIALLSRLLPRWREADERAHRMLKALIPPNDLFSWCLWQLLMESLDPRVDRKSDSLGLNQCREACQHWLGLMVGMMDDETLRQEVFEEATAELGMVLEYSVTAAGIANPALRCRYLTHLAHLRPMDKQRWFAALVQVVHTDQQVVDEEVALLTVLARVMQLPEARLEAALEIRVRSQGGWHAQPVSHSAGDKQA
ncbi:M48 family metallopeptidase [Cobetia sp. L2A1]|uniref:M48 family metallopeptidase n=1 Tax=Cobetia sp. L2A1 TaxID=2686360 RepID=UPI00131CADA4|nr:M48 family metallopeptidase [Cobetia sp. L2A1]